MTDVDVDAVMEGDRRFFRRHRARRHRVRLAVQAEVIQAREGGIDVPPAPLGYRIHVVVRRVSPHARMRQFVAMAEGADTDLGEEVCASIWKWTSSPWRDEVERRIALADVPFGKARA